MNKADWGMFDYEEDLQPSTPTQTPQESKVQPIKQPEEKKSGVNWDMYDPPEETETPEEEEGWLKWAARTYLQVPKGVAQAATYGLDLAQQIGYADATDTEEIDRIRQASERVGKPFDEEAYLAKANEAASMFPTVNNASRYLEENYGIPLEAKTGFQKFVNFASSAAKIAPKNATLRPLDVSLPRPILGTGVAATAEVAKELGVNETLADLASFAILKTPKAGSPSLSFGNKTKPSGLSERNFENVKENTKVSDKTKVKIHEQVESEVRELTEKIIETTPLNDTRKGLSENFRFKEEAGKAFEEVHELARDMPGSITKAQVVNKINKTISEIDSKGFAPSEYEKALHKNLTQFKKDINKPNIKTVDLIDQYKKNNFGAGQLMEPGQSFAYNQAKRDALFKTNRAIAEIIEEIHPGSELSRMFKETNERWSKIMDSEAIDNFLGDMFNGKINFKKGRDFFDKKGIKEPLQKALGKDGFEQFSTLMNDMMSYEQAHKLLKTATSSGAEDALKTMGAYIAHPKLGAAKFGWTALKGGYKTMYEMFLRQPKIGIIWDRGVNAAKKGDFKAAKTEFAKVKKVQEEVEAIKPDEILTPQKPTQKTGETIEGRAERVNKTTPKEETKGNDYVQKRIEEMRVRESLKPAESKRAKPDNRLLEHKPKKDVNKSSPKQIEYEQTFYKEKIGNGPLKGSTLEIRQKKGRYPELLLDGKQPLIERRGPGFSYEYLEKLKRIHELKKRNFYGDDELIKQLTDEIIKDTKKRLEKQISDKQKAITEPQKKARIDKIVTDLGETRGKGQQYHGTGQTFGEINPDHYSEGNIYGQGFYTTDAIDVAQGYSKGKHNDWSAKAPEIFRIDEKSPVKFIDMEKPIPKKLRDKLEKFPYEETEIALDQNPKNLREFYDEVRAQATRDQFQDIAFEIQDILEEMNYGGLRHEGGANTKTKPHEVKIYFKPADVLKITPLKSSRQMSKGAKTPEKIELDHKGSEIKGDDFRDNFMTQKTAQNMAEMNDLPLQIRKLKEKRDTIKGSSQAAIKQRMPYNEKINKLELQLYDQKKPKTVNTAKKVEQKIEHAADKPDITRGGLIKQKSFILNKIDDILENASKYNTRTVEINVPGDGKFNIENDRQALNKFKTMVEKKWPEKALPNLQETYKKKPLAKEKSKEYYYNEIYKIDKKIDSVKKELSGEKYEYRKKTLTKELSDLIDLRNNIGILRDNAKD